MAILPLVFYPNPNLRKPSATVEQISATTLKLMDDMLETMYAAPGIGLAAPQVGVMQRVIVLDVGDESSELPQPLRLVNPEIIASSGSSKMEEGCLSIPDIRDKVVRPAEVTVRALNEKGAEIEIAASGLLATCLQHEIDHLNGILFIDRLSRIRKQLIESKLSKLK